jgi:hypothetical protein
LSRNRRRTLPHDAKTPSLASAALTLRGVININQVHDAVPDPIPLIALLSQN